MSSPSTVLEFVSVYKRFVEGERVRRVLDGASATIGAGELVVLLGRSGSGKSTLLHLGAGLDLADSGEVLLEGRSLAALTERERTHLRRDRVGFVFQAFNLIPTLNVEENLLLAIELRGRIEPAARRRALEILDAVGLGDRRDSFPDRLSGGEQQRVAIARALAHDPALVLADEPTGNLDLDTGLEVLDLLDRLTRQEGKTLVMVTHGTEVVGLADRVLRLDHGKLVEDPAHAAGRTTSGTSRTSGTSGTSGTVRGLT